MQNAVLIAIAIAGVAFGVGALLWSRREVGKARAEVLRAQRPSGLERTLIGGGRAVKAALHTAVRVREQGIGGILSSLEELVGWAERERPTLRKMAASDGTVTIMFSDIEDSTAINDRLGDKAWVALLAAHDRVVRRRVAAGDGYVIKSQGDGFMVAFSEPAQAITCAARIQRDLTERNRRLRKAAIQVRIGIHIGTAVERNGDLFGRNVAYAARVASAGQGGQVLVSSDIAERVGELDGLPFVRPHSVTLKGLQGKHTLYEVAWAS